LPNETKINKNIYYEQGLLYGIDLSSSAAVISLNPLKNEKILDLCCSPGAKLMYISDKMGNTGGIVGIDISQNRLNICKNLITKY